MAEKQDTMALEDSYEFVDSPETIMVEKVEDDLKKLEKTTTHMEFRNQVIKIGQTLRLIASSAKNKDEKSIQENIKELKKLMFPYVEKTPPCSPPEPVWKTLFSGKERDDYALYFCNLINVLNKNIEETGNIKSALYPMGRNEGESPLLIPQYTIPFIIAAKRATRTQDTREIDEILEMTKDLVAMEREEQKFNAAQMKNLYERLAELKKGGAKHKTRKNHKTYKANKSRQAYKSRKNRKTYKANKSRKHTN